MYIIQLFYTCYISYTCVHQLNNTKRKKMVEGRSDPCQRPARVYNVRERLNRPSFEQKKKLKARFGPTPKTNRVLARLLHLELNSYSVDISASCVFSVYRKRSIQRACARGMAWSGAGGNVPRTDELARLAGTGSRPAMRSFVCYITMIVCVGLCFCRTNIHSLPGTRVPTTPAYRNGRTDDYTTPSKFSGSRLTFI